MWATQCAKDIMSEYDNRKKIKKFAKEMTQTRLTNELTEGADNTKMDIDSKVLEGKMRLKYWDYFRNGNLRLLEFMLRFKEYNAGMEIKTSNPQFIRDSKKADEKIKKYIIFLERNNEIALTEVTRIRSVIDKMSKVSTFKGSTLNLPTF